MNPFDDMVDDIAALEGDDTPMGARAPEPVRYEERCDKCRGTGAFYSWAGNYIGPCRACKGTGKRTYARSSEDRAKSRARAAERKVRESWEKIEAFRAQFPAEYEWMGQRAAHFDFAKSMCEALAKWGTLTDRQMEAVQRCMESDRARAAQREQQIAERAAAPVVRLEKLHDVMQRHARFYAGDVTLSRRNADQLVWIKHKDAEKVVGKIDGGVLTLWNRPGVDTGAVRALLDEFEGAPLQAAMKFGKLSGRCCSCGRELTDPASIESGIGPICAGKF